MKPFLRTFLALSLCVSQSVFGQAQSYGAGPDSAVGLSGATTDVASGTTTTVGSGVVAGGLEEAAATIKANVAIIAALPAKALAGGADFTIATLPAMQAGAAEYESSRATCYSAQASAGMMCMEKTNPNLISTIAKVNLGVAGLNSLAVNDACKGMSKIMTLAQGGMTAFLAVCGAMRARCSLTCGATSAALKKLSGATTGGAFCKPLNPATGGAVCSDVLPAYTAAIAKIKAALTQEANAADVTQRPIASKVAVCSQGYGLMLASGAVSLASIIKSMKQSKNCDKDSDGGSSSKTATAAATPAATTAPAAIPVTTGAGIVATETPQAPQTPETSANLIVVPPSAAPVASPTTDPTLGSQVRAASAGQTSGVTGTLSNGVSPGFASDAVKEKNSVYQAYMPGGAKDPARNIAGQSAYDKEVTAAGGKSNWSKTRDAYRSIKTLEDE